MGLLEDVLSLSERSYKPRDMPVMADGIGLERYIKEELDRIANEFGKYALYASGLKGFMFENFVASSYGAMYADGSGMQGQRLVFDIAGAEQNMTVKVDPDNSIQVLYPGLVWATVYVATDDAHPNERVRVATSAGQQGPWLSVGRGGSFSLGYLIPVDGGQDIWFEAERSGFTFSGCFTALQIRTEYPPEEAP